ncbi:ComEA family DNA-binding protein [Desulfococcus sp.]|uniref:ComEA family DNA-binding protein n=1 Tax=Desulfococcus sp. TaxID=2025834 RepID=UPI003593E243
MKRFKLLAAITLVMGCLFCLSAQVTANEALKVNINTASVEELATLNKVGPKTAAKIVEYRAGVGKFNAPEELMNVKGIGEKIFELNKDRIVVGDMDNPAPKSNEKVSQTETEKKG